VSRDFHLWMFRQKTTLPRLCFVTYSKHILNLTSSTEDVQTGVQVPSVPQERMRFFVLR
jgi:hypothetical protein